MKSHNLTSFLLRLTISALLITIIGCTKKEGSKIPITTLSNEAMKHYLQGRELFEKLRVQESLQFFEKAVAEDSNFALGYLNLSFSQSSAKGFFEQFNKAVALADKVTEGERILILGWKAGIIDAEPMKQRDYFQKLVTIYPKDERAHNLLANNYFGQQEWKQAIEEYKTATEIAPNFSPSYNQLGYAYRSLENYSEAEKAFKKYIELIPDDPNPYDSYAELLMKMGKYDESIEQYEKALSLDPNFVASHIGIATNLNFKGKHEEARKQLQKLYDLARNDGERGAAYFAMAVSYVDEGNMGKALLELNNQYALDEKNNDALAMSGDLISIGNVLLEMGRINEAMAKFDNAVQLVEESNLSNEVKENTKRFYLYNSARVALKKRDFETAKVKSEEFRKQVEAINNPNQIRLSHQLAGMIALEEKDYDKATEELQADQQNPYNLYRIALAYSGKDDKEKCREFCMRAARFNALNNLNYAFIRNKAEDMLSGM